MSWNSATSVEIENAARRVHGRRVLDIRRVASRTQQIAKMEAQHHAIVPTAVSHRSGRFASWRYSSRDGTYDD